MLLRGKRLAAATATAAALAVAVPAAQAELPGAAAPSVHVDPISPYLAYLPPAVGCPVLPGGLRDGAQVTRDNPSIVYTAVLALFGAGCGPASAAP
jgi:hypothetical protein